MRKDANGQREVAGSFGFQCPGREEEGTQPDRGGLPLPSVHVYVADSIAEPAPLMEAVSLGVMREMAVLR